MEAFMVTLYLMEAIGPPQLLMHLRVRNLAQTWRWPVRDFPLKIACHFISEYYRSFSRSFFHFLRTPLTSRLLTLYECILSCSLFLSLLSSPLYHPFPPTHDSLSLWYCRGNLILDCLEFPRIPFGVAPGTTQRQTSAVGAKSSKHRLIIPPCSFLLHWSCLLLFSK